jgi:hypothetical protein
MEATVRRRNHPVRPSRGRESGITVLQSGKRAGQRSIALIARRQRRKNLVQTRVLRGPNQISR